MTSSQHTLIRGGSTVHWWVQGPEAGPLVALAHGASMDHHMFDAQLDTLVGAGYRVLTWDVRGHGLSQPLGQTPLTIADMTDDLVAILDELGVVGPICVGGQSMGGYIAQDLVRRMPDRVTALVIIGAVSTAMPITRWESWLLRSSTAWFVVWPWGHLKRALAKATAVRPAVREYAYRAVSAMTKPDFIAVWKAVTRAINPDPDYRVNKPLLLTHGDSDRTGAIAAQAPIWADQEPRCRYAVIPDAGHNANQDNPEFFNAVLLEFLTAHYPVPTA